MQKILLLDADSTLFNEEVIDLIAERAGIGQEVAEITEQAMQGLIDFPTALKKRVSLLEGLPASDLAEVSQKVTITNGGRELIVAAREKGYLISVVSGGFIEVIAPIMEHLDIDDYHANSLEIANGYLTGAVVGEIVDRDAKVKWLLDLSKKFRINIEDTIAIGDGANDIGMVQAAHLGIAFCAKPALKKVANVIIDERDLKLVEPYL
ncbi:MAG: phosphoserine phosphatase SerB [Candidatus Nanopelagicaceae bacterium]|jgi:phosphoserine phosphatase